MRIIIFWGIFIGVMLGATIIKTYNDNTPIFALGAGLAWLIETKE